MTGRIIRFLIPLLIVNIFLLIKLFGVDVTQQHEIRILSYNIRHGEGMDKRIDLKRIAEVISKTNPDLIALQEVDKNCERSGKIDIALELGAMLGMESRFGKFMEFQGGEYGMAVLSKFPIINSRRIELPEGKKEPRCALEIVVQPEASSSPVSFICIHNDWIDETARVAQIKALLDAINDVKHPIILAGDFNGEMSDNSMQILLKEDWNILDKNGQKTYPSQESSVEIDFIVTYGFQSATFECDIINEQIASDHRPISAVILFQDEQNNEEQSDIIEDIRE
ncbi:endonuclease/exonuclease/phosphatase family protein [Bacteroidota bacterium]